MQVNAIRRRNMKKSIITLAYILTVAAICSCSPQKETIGTEKSSKVLVVYYSATGTTENVARNIAEATSADIFEITPSQPYTSADLNWNNSQSRVSKEHNDESFRNVELISTEVPNWEDYDTVFIGYPIWWGIAAWPTDSFVKANSFEGKTVIPFATSASSGMGQSETRLASEAGNGDWKAGRRFSSRTASSEIQSWAKDQIN